LKFF